MATSPWYREGTAKFTEGSTTVTGTGTRWVDFVRAGDGIQGPDGKLYQVTNVASNTSMSITPAYGSETTYWTIPIQGYVKRLADAASQLVRDFEGGADEALDAADRAKQSATEASVSENAALSQANRAEGEADRAELEADRAQQAADDAVAVVTGGDASIEPEAGKIPIAGASGTIKQAWVHELEFALDKLRVATNKALYGDGPYPVLDFQFQGANMLDPRIEFTRASKDWDSQGREYGINEPVLTDEGLWVSGARTNLIPNSQNIDSWTTNNCEVVQSDGGWAEITRTVTTGEARPRVDGIAVTPETLYVLSVDAKEATSRYIRVLARTTVGGSNNFPLVNFDLRTGEVTQSLGSNLVTGWTVALPNGGFRCAVIFNSSESTLTNVYLNVVDTPTGSGAGDPVGSSIYMKKPQLEVGEVATPYIPTEGSQVTVAKSTAFINLGAEYMERLFNSGFTVKIDTHLQETGNVFESFTGAFKSDGGVWDFLTLIRRRLSDKQLSMADQNNSFYSLIDYLGGAAAMTYSDGEVALAHGGQYRSQHGHNFVYSEYNSFSLSGRNSGNLSQEWRGFLKNYCVYATYFDEQGLLTLTS